MRLLKITFLSVVLLGIVSCDDALVDMDLSPPLAGHLWRVYGGAVEGGGGVTRLESYSFREGYDGGFSSSTPFDGGDAYGVACGDGRVWVTGIIRDDLESYDALWEAEGETYPNIGGGGEITYNGEFVWSVVGRKIYRINPDTGEEELIYDQGYDGDFFYCDGATWANNHLWILSTREFLHIIEFDIEMESVLNKIPLPDDPYLSEPRGLAWDGEAFWVNDLKSSRMYRLDGKDGHILGYIEMQEEGQLPRDEPRGLAFGRGPTTPTR